MFAERGVALVTGAGPGIGQSIAVALLIVVATLALRGYRTGLIHHTLLALREGATPAEIRGCILVTLASGGFAACSPGLAWADEILLPYERGEFKLSDHYG